MGKKEHNIALIIPIINEGERIIQLLNRIKVKNLHNLIDIILVDGGSSDGSLKLDLFKSLNVKYLLIKYNSNGLSQQLQFAYAFALENKYNGLITIDGNNKDDPSSIPQFIKLLKEGFDFIQASRFINGGYHKNTPIHRTLGIKLIHAPILSFFSGFKWTDTTQGFRGYSSKVLSDKKIKIFRSIFKTYELLAYLSYIIPKYGYKCIEVPTTREYPLGKNPTKINGFIENFKIFMILLKTCLGRYNVNQEDE